MKERMLISTCRKKWGRGGGGGGEGDSYSSEANTFQVGKLAVSYRCSCYLIHMRTINEGGAKMKMY